MTEERLKELQETMSDQELITEVERQISELARTGGRSHKMCVPPMPTDIDMILSELVRRYKRALAKQSNENIQLGMPAVMGELTCDSCGCHPNVIYTTSKGRFCERCKPAS